MISCWDATNQITHPEDFGDLLTFHQDKRTFKIFIEGPDHIPAPQRINPLDSIDHMIFSPGQTSHLRILWLWGARRPLGVATWTDCILNETILFIDESFNVLPDDVIIVSQVEPLAVFSGVVNHADPGHEVHHLLPGGVVQVIPALVAPVPVDPVQPEPAARGAPVRHVHSSDGSPCCLLLLLLLLI